MRLQMRSASLCATTTMETDGSDGSMSAANAPTRLTRAPQGGDERIAGVDVDEQRRRKPEDDNREIARGRVPITERGHSRRRQCDISTAPRSSTVARPPSARSSASMSAPGAAAIGGLGGERLAEPQRAVAACAAEAELAERGRKEVVARIAGWLARRRARCRGRPRAGK